MTLSLFLLLLLPVFVVPAIFLSLNRLRSYFLPSIFAFALVFSLYLFQVFFPSLEVEEKIGKAFLGMWQFLFRPFIELSQGEIYHLSFDFTLLFLYLLTYTIFFFVTKIYFIGDNPSIHKQVRHVRHTYVGIFFVVFTYGALFFFLISIREILPFEDGFLSFFFPAIYPIEA